MTRNQSRKKTSVMAMLSIVALVFTFVQIVSAQQYAGAAANQDDKPVSEFPATDDSCRLQITIQGQGTVAVQGSGRDGEVLGSSEALQIPCGDAVELSANPAPGWRFDRWEGVAEAMQSKSTIFMESPADLTVVFAPREILRYESLAVPFVDRGGQLVTEVPILESVWRSSTAVGATNAAPKIDVWYGDDQPFGQNGDPQKWVNILGNVSDSDGNLEKLEYSLNGKPPVKLNVGGDGHRGDGLRLYRQGDFNIDLDRADLVNGPNTVVITATDTLSETESTVTVNYDAGNTWPLPYTINWNAAGSIQDVAQVVDGDWDLSAAGVTPKENQTGYDRIVALGDLTWTDFELTVPVTVNGYDTNGFGGRYVVPAIGIVMRWEGHTTTPDLCAQPLCGYLPVGATSWYAFESKSSEVGQFSMWDKPSNKVLDASKLTLNWGQTYNWKVRSESLPGTKGLFKMKVWPASATEPTDWLVTMQGTNSSLQNGSVLLLSHFVDVTFGDITVLPVTPGEGPPEITNWKVIPEPNGATIRWLTDEPATSRVDYGTTTSYGETVQSAALVTQHSLYLPDLEDDRLHHFQITSQDASDESASTADLTFNTQQLISLISEDFNTCTLEPEWQFVDQLEDGTFELNGIQAEISVPAGTDHDIWPDPELPTIRAPHLLHPVTDPNNLKVKFDSTLSLDRQLQGILVKQDDQNFLRINYQYQDGKLKLYVIGFSSVSSPVIFKSLTINSYNPAEPLYLLLNRQDGQWQVSYSTDNVNWSETGSFAFPLAVTQAGIFAGNFNKTAGNEPPFTAVVDYFFDANAPINPEDADPLHLPVNISGNGSVSKDPTCGSPVTLRAEADPGWRFVEWQGADVDGQTRLEITTAFTAGDEVTAVFEVGEPEMYTLDIQANGQGAVLKDPDQSEYIAGEVVELTADPAPGWAFDSWGGDLSGTNAVISFEMDGDKVVMANFEEAELNLDITVEGPGQVQISPLGPYEYGQQVTLTAVPAVGSLSSFGGWSGDIDSSDNPLIIEIMEDMALTAKFVTYKQFLPITVRPSG